MPACRFRRRLEHDLRPRTAIGQTLRCKLQPCLAGTICRRVTTLVEHNATAALGRRRLVDECDRFICGIGVETTDEINIEVTVREWSCFTEITISQKVRIRHGSFRLVQPSDHPAIQERQFRVNAGHRTGLPRGARDTERHALGQDEVEDAIVQPCATDGRGDGRFDRPSVSVSIDPFLDRRADVDHVRVGNGSRRCVRLSNPLRVRTVVVDDDGNVFGGLRRGAHRSCHEDRYRGEQDNDLASSTVSIGSTSMNLWSATDILEAVGDHNVTCLKWTIPRLIAGS